LPQKGNHAGESFQQVQGCYTPLPTGKELVLDSSSQRPAEGGETRQRSEAIQVHTEQASRFADRYTTKRPQPYQDCFAYSRLRLDRLLARYLPARGDGLRLLDLGCGTGHYMKSLREQGFEVAGVDASPAMLQHARTNNPGAEIHEADVATLPFANGRFDYVLCIEVLRYLSNPTPAIQEIARVLKPGGIALVTATPVWNLNGYWMINQISRRMRIGNLTPLRQFFTTSRRLRKQFRNAGFETAEVHGVYLGPINWVERIARPLLPTTLRLWEPVDRALADRALIRDFSNMFLVRAIRGGA
jgi:ubiquinone/menaquinone biosynthesis C-methylase UbiE